MAQPDVDVAIDPRAGVVRVFEFAPFAHALIVYSERSMPEQPSRFQPTEDLKLVSRATTAAEIKAPRYSPEDLGRTMGGFVIERGRLLADGMQEMLFRLPM